MTREVARIVLPLTIYSSMYVTLNARSLMNFLSLRTTHPESAYPSYPQREIEMCAEQMEAAWAQLMPLTHEVFAAHGRVAPDLAVFADQGINLCRRGGLRPSGEPGDRG